MGDTGPLSEQVDIVVEPYCLLQLLYASAIFGDSVEFKTKRFRGQGLSVEFAVPAASPASPRLAREMILAFVRVV